MRLSPAIAGLCVAAAAFPALAQEGQRFHDAATGLTIDLPARFALAGKQDRPNYDIAVAVKTTEGGPRSANADGVLCGVAYVNAPSNEGLSQAEINAVVAGEGWLSTARGPLAVLGKVEQAQTFTQPGARGAQAVKGGEFVVAPSTGPDADKARIYIAMWETPKGRVVVSCAGLAAEMPGALEAFRQVRGGVTAGG